MPRFFLSRPGEREPTEVKIESLPLGRVAVTIGPLRREVDAVFVEPGTVSLLLDGQSHSIELDPIGDEVRVQVGRHFTRFEVADERKRQRGTVGGFLSEGKQVVRSPMPGKIVKVLVRLGDEVQAGQGLVVVEAMKMENELKSPRAGKITQLTATEGATVENNAPLLTVE